MNRTGKAAMAFWGLVQKARAARAAGRPESPVFDDVPEDVRVALARLDEIRDRCRALVTRRATVSAGAAIIPFPGLDVGTDIAILVRLLPQINEEFGLSPEQIESLDVDTKRTVMLFVSSVGSSFVGRMVTRRLVIGVLKTIGVRVTAKGIVKFVPLLGQAVSASISFGAMKMLGNQHIDDCYVVARGALLQRAGEPVPTTWEVVK